MRKTALLIIPIIVLITSCVSSEQTDTQDVFYYNFKHFFSQEVEKLTKENPTIEKTIIHNNQQESKSLKIDNWDQELALFIESDINKASWKNSYTKDSTSQRVIYTAKEESLRIRKSEVHFADGKPVKFSFVNQTSNYLYTSEEHLEYYPDSLYFIHKKQKVVLLGDNDYKITGRLTK
ncbi:hypothetical protein EIM50_20815 [Pseudoxanthomonas sp. SGD-10]|nr:hypothetical protein EIM50_20815 [Pseudoxanthomonas sp. SGD-10]